MQPTPTKGDGISSLIVDLAGVIPLGDRDEASLGCELQHHIKTISMITYGNSSEYMDLSAPHYHSSIRASQHVANVLPYPLTPGRTIPATAVMAVRPLRSSACWYLRSPRLVEFIRGCSIDRPKTTTHHLRASGSLPRPRGSKP